MAGLTPLVFVTTNAGKLREARDWLSTPVEGVDLELDELQTTDLDALTRHKTEQAYARLGRPLLVEDTALTFAAWGALPGPFIKFFLSELGTRGIVQALQPFGDDRAECTCTVGYHDGGAVHLFTGRVTGRIVPPRGEQGFGWDPIFEPEGVPRTFGEMALAEKQRHSMRARAFSALAAYLHERG
ncbi:MAG TPA: non-canonical purine NTP pyrophosphatase [bacterium]|nr:non-canonical purine NTP pyrophosphatase [bacterium]